MTRVDKHTEKFVTKEVHGQMVRVRILKPHKAEDEITTAVKRKRPNKRYCFFCETEVFDAGKDCDLCGREF